MKKEPSNTQKFKSLGGCNIFKQFVKERDILRMLCGKEPLGYGYDYAYIEKRKAKENE